MIKNRTKIFLMAMLIAVNSYSSFLLPHQREGAKDDQMTSNPGDTSYEDFLNKLKELDKNGFNGINPTFGNGDEDKMSMDMGASTLHTLAVSKGLTLGLEKIKHKNEGKSKTAKKLTFGLNYNEVTDEVIKKIQSSSKFKEDIKKAIGLNIKGEGPIDVTDENGTKKIKLKDNGIEEKHLKDKSITEAKLDDNLMKKINEKGNLIFKSGNDEKKLDIKSGETVTFKQATNSITNGDKSYSGDNLITRINENTKTLELAFSTKPNFNQVGILKTSENKSELASKLDAEGLELNGNSNDKNKKTKLTNDGLTLQSKENKKAKLSATDNGDFNFDGKKLTNIKDGSVKDDSKEAITGSQLKKVVDALGGDAKFDENTGTWTNPKYKLKAGEKVEKEHHTVGDALSGLDKAITSNKKEIDEIKSKTDNKLDKNGSNIEENNKDEFGKNVGTEKITGDSTKLVQEKAVVDYINDKKTAEKIIKNAKDEIIKIAGESVNVTEGENISVKAETENGKKTYKISAKTDGKVEENDEKIVSGKTVYSEVRPTKDGKYVKKNNTTAKNLEALDDQVKKNEESIKTLKTDVDKEYAKKDASNIENGDITKWQDKLEIGKGTIGGNSDTKTVTGSKVKEYVENQKTVETIIEKGKDKITKIAGESVKVEAGDNVEVTSTKDEKTGVNTYKISAKTDGKVAKDNKGIISGDTLYNETKIDNSKNQYIKDEKTTGENLTALDKEVKSNKDAIAENKGAIEKLKLEKGVSEKRLEEVKSELSGGIAQAMAMGSIPQVGDDKLVSVGAGVAYYGKTGGFALGVSGTDKGRNVVYKIAAGIDTKANFGASAGINYNFVDNKQKNSGKCENCNDLELKKLKDENKDLRNKYENLENKFNELLDKINQKPKVIEKKIVVSCFATDKKCVVNGFEVDGQIPSREEQEQLKNVVKKINEFVSEGNVDVIGHTDSDGSNEYNKKLSIKRANTLVNLLQKFGLKDSLKIRNVLGEGEEKPLRPNTTKYNKYLNRRVELNFDGINVE